MIAPFTNDQIEKIKLFQLNKNVHPLTCPDNHKPYDNRILSVDTNGLYCKICGYRQEHIPDFCFEYYNLEGFWN